MALGNFSHHKNIKDAKQSKPKHTFSNIKKNHRKQSYKPKITTMKVDKDTLNKIRALQHILLFNTRTKTIRKIVHIAINDLISKHKINKNEFRTVLKVFNKDT